MKDKLEKVSEALVKTTELLEGGKSEEALAKFKETAELLKEAQAEAAEAEGVSNEATPEDVEKTAQVAEKLQTELKKYADLFVSASNVEELKNDLKTLFTEAIGKVEANLEKKYDAQMAEMNKKLESPEDSKQVTKTVTGEEDTAKSDPLNPFSHK